MASSTPEQLSFHPVAGHTIRAACEGGAFSSDFGALFLRGIARQIGLTARLAAAIHETRHPSSIAHPLHDFLAQRIYPNASGYADGNDANSLRRDPLFQLGVERLPLAPEQALARAPTFARLAHRVDRKALSRWTQALGAHGVASYPEPPAAMVLDLDHPDDPTHGQQELTFDNHYDKTYCSIPFFIFEGLSGALVTACLRPGTRPPGRAKALIVVRRLAFLRRHWPQTPILVRGDSHCATPAVLAVLAPRHRMDCVFGLAGHPVLLRHATPVIQEARRLHQQRTTLAQAHHVRPPDSRRLYAAFTYGAASWAQPWRVILTAAVMAAGDHPRFVVTSLAAPTPQCVYEDISGARGTCANHLKAVKGDLHSDRTSATTFLANAMRLLLSCAASALHHALRTQTLQQTALAQAQPATVILTLCKVATKVKKYQDRLLLHLPSSCPVKALLQRVTALL
jgi:hypothetical protein